MKKLLFLLPFFLIYSTLSQEIINPTKNPATDSKETLATRESVVNLRGRRIYLQRGQDN